MTWNMARNTEKCEKWEMHSVGSGIFQEWQMHTETTWNMAKKKKNTEKPGKWKMHTVEPGIWRETLKNFENHQCSL